MSAGEAALWPIATAVALLWCGWGVRLRDPLAGPLVRGSWAGDEMGYLEDKAAGERFLLALVRTGYGAGRDAGRRGRSSRWWDPKAGGGTGRRAAAECAREGLPGCRGTNPAARSGPSGRRAPSASATGTDPHYFILNY